MLVVTGATLVVTSALLVVTMFAIRNKCHASSNRCHASSNKCLTSSNMLYSVLHFTKFQIRLKLCQMCVSSKEMSPKNLGAK